MPKPTTKTRQELRSRFARNAIPTEGDYADLIAAGLNQADDGILKLPDQPLGLVRQKPTPSASSPTTASTTTPPPTASSASAPAPPGVLNLFGDSADERPSWQLQLIGTTKPGFALADQAGATRLFLDGTTGNLGVGTNPTEHKLTVAGTLNVAGTFNSVKDPASSLTNGGQLAIKGDRVQLDFIDTDHPTDWAINVDNGKLSFVRSPDSKDLVIDDKGNVGIGTETPTTKLNVNGDISCTGSVTSALGRSVAKKTGYVFTTATNWVVMDGMQTTITLKGKATVLFLFKTGGVQKIGDGEHQVHFRMMVNSTMFDHCNHEFTTHQKAWRDAVLMSLDVLDAGEYKVEIQWKGTGATAEAGFGRTLLAIAL